MSRAHFLLVFLGICLTAASVGATRSVGERMEGDELLMHEVIPRESDGLAHLRRRFDGYIITYIEFIIPPHLNEALFSLEIYRGGVSANFVDLCVKFLNFRTVRVMAKVYGLRVKSGAADGESSR